MGEKLSKREKQVLYEVYLGKHFEFTGDSQRVLRTLHRKNLIKRGLQSNRVRLVLTDAGRQALGGNE